MTGIKKHWVQNSAVFFSRFLILAQIYQEVTRILYGIYVNLLRQPLFTHKTFTNCGIVDHWDDKQLNIRYFTCFLNHFKLIDLLRMFQVENERMARSIANKVL